VTTKRDRSGLARPVIEAGGAVWWVAATVALLVLPAPAVRAADGTITGTASAVVGGCSLLTVTAPFTGDDNGDGAVMVEVNTVDSWPGTVACGAVGGPSPRMCQVTGLSASTGYFLRVTYGDPDGVSGTPVQVLPGPLTTTVCSGDGAPPMILFLSPTRNAVVGGPERFRIQVYDPDGVSASNVTWALDGSAPTLPVTTTGIDCNLTGQTGCAVFELDLDTTQIANGPHFVTVEAVDSAAVPATARMSWAFRVNNAGTEPAGSGTLLRRTHGSQLCSDCHNLATHSRQALSARYGSWAEECLGCHTPHDTANIFLVREQIETPSSGVRSVDFRNTDGLANYSYASATQPGTGVCEVCHTKTRNSDGTPRFRNTGESDGGKHYASQCTACHTHALGFAAGESGGGVNCSSCHPDIFQGMTGALGAASRHALGTLVGVNDAFADSGIDWGSPLAANGAAARSCVNMCHQDHVHNAPGGTTHDFNVHSDAATATSRAVTRDGAGNIIAGTPARTDFEPAAATGGMCVSCHRNAVESGRPVIDRDGYDASAHDYVSNTVGTSTFSWSYLLHDGSAFDRNCTKCHADGDASPGASAIPFGAVHYSDYPKLLSGSVNPAGTPGDFVCYRCHGNGSTGDDYSGKDIATDMAKSGPGTVGVKHPVDDDASHDSLAEVTVAYATTGNLFATDRHVNCEDCHEPHTAQAGVHDYTATATGARNQASNALVGASGVEFRYSTATGAPTDLGPFAIPGADNYAWVPHSTGVAYEYQICLKCHASFAWGTTTPPNGVSPNGSVSTPVETDVALELNPNNPSYHPVVAGLTGGGSSPLASNQMKAPWAANPGSQTMMCTDCHNTDAGSAAAQGPHGSAVQFMLRGPNSANWPNVTLSNFGTSWCANCHTSTIGGGVHTRGDHSGVRCYGCHIVVPHGGKIGRLIATDTTGLPSRYAWNNDRTTVEITSFNKRTSSQQYQKSDCQASCTSEHSSGGGASW